MPNIRGKPTTIHIYVGTIVLAGTLAFWLGTRNIWSSALSDLSLGGVLTFVAVGLGLELSLHKLTFRSAGGSIAFIAFLGAALVFGPAWGSLVTAVSLASAHLINRVSPVKILFNVGQYVLAIIVGSWVYAAAGGAIPPSSLGSTIGPFAAFVLVFFFINSASVSGAIALSEHRSFMEVWVRNTWGLAGYDVVASMLGLALAWLYLKFGYLGVGLVVIPTLFMRHTYSVNLQLQETQRELLELMVKAIEARDLYTSGHSQRVSELARELARGLRMSFKEVENVGTAALLHDVGKIYEEFAPILRKEGKLTPEEQILMQTHPVRSAELVGTISSLHGEVYKCVRHHHENVDGSGYPDGLIGEQIPKGARVIMVADTVDAMTTDRPYRKALSFEKVFQELEKYSGTQFDPEVVEALRRRPGVRQLIEKPVFEEEQHRERGRERVAQLAVR